VAGVEGFAGAFHIVWMVVPVVVEERLERHSQVHREGLPQPFPTAHMRQKAAGQRHPRRPPLLVSRAPVGRRKNASVEVDPALSSVCWRAAAQTLRRVPAYGATRMNWATWRLARLSLGRPVEPT
jgi:hypothetical protein